MKRKKAAGDRIVKSKLAAVPTQRTKGQSIAEQAQARQQIEDIFSSHKPVRQVPETPDRGPAKRPKGSKDDIFGTQQSTARRRDPEGLAVYQTEELNIGQGGDTELCPFDCKCCY